MLIRTWILDSVKFIFEREICITEKHQNKELLVSFNLGDNYTKHYITPRDLELIRTKSFASSTTFTENFFACQTYLTYKSLVIYPLEEMEYPSHPKFDELL